MYSQEDLLSKLLNNRRLLFIIGGVIIGVIILSIVLTSSKADIQKEIAQLSSQTSEVTSLAEGAQSELDDSSMLASNATIIATLTDVDASLGALAGAKKIDKATIELQAAHADELATELDSAKVASTYSVTYKKIIIEELDQLALDIRAVSKKTNTTVRSNLQAAATRVELLSKLNLTN